MTIAEPTIRHFTRDEYYRMAEIGLFDGQRVELIQGEIITMSPQNNPHALTISIVAHWLHKSLPDNFTIRCQLPLVASDDTEPEPDFAVLPGSPESQREHPTTALLVIEISDSTLRHDRRKADLYASKNVPDYWILNLQNRTLERYQNPAPNPASPFNSSYSPPTVLNTSQSIQPLQLPIASIPIERLFPTTT